MKFNESNSLNQTSLSICLVLWWWSNFLLCVDIKILQILSGSWSTGIFSELEKISHSNASQTNSSTIYLYPRRNFWPLHSHVYLYTGNTLTANRTHMKTSVKNIKGATSPALWFFSFNPFFVECFRHGYSLCSRPHSIHAAFLKLLASTSHCKLMQTTTFR